MNQKSIFYLGLIVLYILSHYCLKAIPAQDYNTNDSNFDCQINVANQTSINDLNNIDSVNVQHMKYYKFCNLAARAIYENNYYLASSLYDSAFQYRKIPFYLDLVNYILVNDKSCLYNKNDAAIRYLIIDKKIPSNRLFERTPKRVFNDNNIALINKLLKVQDEINSSENDYQIGLRKIFELDQNIRDYENISKLDSATQMAIYASRDSIDNANFIRFKNLYSKYGFPGEETVGIYFDNENEWASIIYVLLLHFIQKQSEEVKISTIQILNKALNAGKLHPTLYAPLLDGYDLTTSVRREGYNFLATTVFLVGSDVYRPFVFYSDSLMKDVNTKRISIGLDSFHITQKQVVCQNFGSQNLKDTTVISMVHYPQIATLPSGFVKMSAKEANVDLETYKINIPKILNECNCMAKIY